MTSCDGPAQDQTDGAEQANARMMARLVVEVREQDLFFGRVEAPRDPPQFGHVFRVDVFVPVAHEDRTEPFNPSQVSHVELQQTARSFPPRPESQSNAPRARDSDPPRFPESQP